MNVAEDSFTGTKAFGVPARRLKTGVFGCLKQKNRVRVCSVGADAAA
jgi:hypothetical protein